MEFIYNESDRMEFPQINITPVKRMRSIIKAIHDNKYSDLGVIEMPEDSNLETIKIKVIPHEGFHRGIEYVLRFHFYEDNSWPLLYIDSPMYDKIKTSRYLSNRGKTGIHKGICIKNLSYGYAFTKNFKDYCGNDWTNYVYYMITLFNNLEDFEKGNGFKSNYKEILSL
jgi:hypothetical protein